MQHEILREPESFIRRLIEHLRSKVSKSIKLEYQKVIKTNDTQLNALMVHNMNSSISKTIYLDELLKRFSEGECMEEIVNQIVELCNSREEVESIDGVNLLEQMQDWQHLLNGNITLKLINREKSRKYLEGKTYLPFLDLAIVFCMTVNGITNGIGTVAIPESASKHWGIGLDEAFKQAIDIVQESFPLKRNTLKDMMFEIVRNASSPQIAEGIIELLQLMDMDTEMYVQTNAGMLNGAVTVLYNNVLSKMCEELKTQALYILPSSLHEVLILKKEHADGAALKRIVKEVNATQVAEDEILSDNIYIYDDVSKEISIWEEG